MRRYDFPIAPVILGVILGPLMEIQLRRALQGSGGDVGRVRRATADHRLLVSRSRRSRPLSAGPDRLAARARVGEED